MGRISQSAERTVVRASATEIPQVFRDPLPLGGTGKILQQQLIEELRGGDYFWFALLLLSGIGSAGAWLRHYFNRDEREENTSHRNRIQAMVSRVHTAESNQELLAMQREVDAIIGETLECYDDGAIEEEELAAFGLVLELFNHAIGARRVALQASTLEPARVAAVGSSLTSRR